MKARSSILLLLILIGLAVMIDLTRETLLPKDVTSSQTDHNSKTNDILNHRSSARPRDVEKSGKENDLIAIAIRDVRVKGSYEKIKTLLRSMNRTERFQFLAGSFCTLDSSFGFRLDIPEKMAVIDEFGEGRADHFKQKVLTHMIFQIDASNDVDFLGSISPDLWRRTLAAAATDNASKAFELSKANVGIERQQQGVREVLRVWLGADSAAASERVARMPQGQLRDVATSEIVCWLKSKNSIEDAKRWAESIRDPAIRDKALVTRSKKP